VEVFHDVPSPEGDNHRTGPDLGRFSIIGALFDDFPGKCDAFDNWFDAFDGIRPGVAHSSDD
jgi:hypothetical protein